MSTNINTLALGLEYSLRNKLFLIENLALIILLGIKIFLRKSWPIYSFRNKNIPTIFLKFEKTTKFALVKFEGKERFGPTVNQDLVLHNAKLELEKLALNIKLYRALKEASEISGL